MISVNTLIEFVREPSAPDGSPGKEEAPLVDRVLYIDIENDLLVAIEIFSEKSLPVLVRRSEIIAAIDSGRARVLEIDPFDSMMLSEENIPKKHRELRDQAFAAIAPVIQAGGLRQYLGEERGNLVKKALELSILTKMMIYKHLKRYWKSGMRKNALLPHYKNCGTNSEWRGNAESHKKLGRPSNSSKSSGKNPGINITREIKRYFERGIKLYLHRRGEKTSLRWTYRRIIGQFFNKGYEYKNSVPVPIIKPSEERPTFRQFYHWYTSTYANVKKELSNRFGRFETEMNHRALLGDSTGMAFGPGSLYQIDATIGDIYLVSEFDRARIIGRPVIYFVIDTFSRYITGIAVTLEGPSWLGAMLALDNVVCDKTEFCAEHGISIDPDNWNCEELSEKLLGDRGELEGYAAEPLVNNLGIVIQNAAPFRADFKGIVERAFGKANEKFIHFLPGAVKRERKRGQRDHRLDAILTLKEFRGILISYVLHHNSGCELTHYNPDEFLITDKVDLYPQDLWNWGIRNRSGHLRSFSREVVRLNLLPRKNVSVTQFGIHYGHDIHYTCELAETEGWFERARLRGSWKIEIAYDPRDLTNIYIPPQDGRNVAVCTLTPASRTFAARNVYDIEDYFHSKTERREENNTRSLQTDAEHHAITEKIIKEAKRKTNAAKAAAGQSNAQQVSNIQNNRKAEKEAERAAQVFDLSGKDANPLPVPAAPAISTDDDDDGGYVAPENEIQKIRNLTRRK